MKVTVKLLGALGDLADTADISPIDFTLPEAATATDLVAQLAQRFGGPFGESSADTTASESGCPSRIQLFVNGEFSPKRDVPLAVSGAESATVQVVIMKTITGG